MPDFVRKALDVRGLLQSYLERPPCQRIDYSGRIDRAKRDADKRKRLAQMLDELAGGYMNRAWRIRIPRSGRGTSR